MQQLLQESAYMEFPSAPWRVSPWSPSVCRSHCSQHSRRATLVCSFLPLRRSAERWSWWIAECWQMWCAVESTRSGWRGRLCRDLSVIYLKNCWVCRNQSSQRVTVDKESTEKGVVSHMHCSLDSWNSFWFMMVNPTAVTLSFTF